MPLITRQLKGSKLSIEEMDNNLTYLENLAISNLRDYVQLLNKPLVIDSTDRWNSTKEIKLDNHHLYIDGPYTLRFTNQVNEGGPNFLFRAWDWDGPSGLPPTPYQNEELVYNERAQISFTMESTDKSSLSLKSFDWTSGTQSGIEFDYKFYQGSIILPLNSEQPTFTDGTIAFSDGVNWDPDLASSPALNVRINGEWKQVNLGPGVQGATGPSGEPGPQGATGPSYVISNYGQNKLVTSDGTEGGLFSQDNLTFDGSTFSLIGDLKVIGSIDQVTLKFPILESPQLTYSNLQGDTTLQNITTILVDGLIVDQSVVNFDFQLGSVFYISNPANDFTLNITNLPTTDSRTINVTIFVDQGLSAFKITNVQIDSDPQTIKWIGATPPTVTPGTITAYTFNILRSGNVWAQVLGAAGIYG